MYCWMECMLRQIERERERHMKQIYASTTETCIVSPERRVLQGSVDPSTAFEGAKESSLIAANWLRAGIIPKIGRSPRPGLETKVSPRKRPERNSRFFGLSGWHISMKYSQSIAPSQRRSKYGITCACHFISRDLSLLRIDCENLLAIGQCLCNKIYLILRRKPSCRERLAVVIYNV